MISRLLLFLVGFVYPSYKTFKALKRGPRATGDDDEDAAERWQQFEALMRYWVVFAVFTTTETALDYSVGLVMPFYNEIKVGLVLYLALSADGASAVYSKFVAPFLLRHEGAIDAALERWSNEAYHQATLWGARLVALVREHTAAAIQRSAATLAAAGAGGSSGGGSPGGPAAIANASPSKIPAASGALPSAGGLLRRRAVGNAAANLAGVTATP